MKYAAEDSSRDLFLYIFLYIEAVFHLDEYPYFKMGIRRTVFVNVRSLE